MISLLAPLAVLAALTTQDVTVRAFVDRAEVTPNQAFTLSVEISGSSTRLASDPSLPDLSNFASFLGSGSSQQIQIVGGRTTVSMTLQYRYQAVREGTHEIGPVEVVIGGRTYRTDPLRITITPNPSSPSGPPAGSGPSTSPSPGTAETIDPEDVFLRATTNKTTVYQNEPVIVEYKIYTRVQVSAYDFTRRPTTAGFWVEDFPIANPPETTTEVINGQRYVSATLKKMALFPTGPGTKTVEPLAIEANVRIQRRSLDPFDDFFRSGSIFGRTVTVPITSEPLTIEVQPLPTDSRPTNFSGFVGALEIEASVDKTTLETNEAVTLSLRIIGEGNVRTLPDPTLEFPADFEVYPPETGENIERTGNRVRGTRTFDYVLVPRTPGTKTIPVFRYHYFDLATRRYRAAETALLTLEVTGTATIAGPMGGRTEVRSLGRDIRFIQTRAPALRPIDRSIVNTAAFWIILLTPLAVIGGAWAARHHRDRIEGDVAYARDRRARRRARKRLATAAQLVDPSKRAEFYAETAKALLGFLGDKLNLAEAGLLRDDVHDQLRGRGLPEDTITAYLDCLDVCDRMRFAPQETSEADMRAFLARSEAAMSDLDEHLTS